jgi:hypothetical protein
MSILNNAYHEVALMTAPKQRRVIDRVFTRAPALQAVPTFPTTDGWETVYEIELQADSMEIVNLDEKLPIINSNTDLRRVQIGIMGGKMLIPKDKARALGGAAAAFAKKLPSVLKQTGMNMERAIFEKTFLPAVKIHAATTTNAPDARHEDHTDFFKKISGGVANNVAGEWILAVRWEEGVVSGLYNPDGYGNKNMFNPTPISGGNMYTLGEEAGPLKGVEGFGQILESNFGILLADPDYVSGMYAGDLTETATDGEIVYTAIPLKGDLQRMIHLVEGSSADTIFYCSPGMFSAMKAAYGTYMGQVVYTSPVGNIEFTFQTFDGIPFITSYNFKKVAFDNI